jgi:hypothetical protein
VAERPRGYVYDGDKLVAQYIAGTLGRRYVRGAGTDEPLVWYEGAALTDRRWLHTDHHGSVIATSDRSGATAAVAGTVGFGHWTDCEASL